MDNEATLTSAALEAMARLRKAAEQRLNEAVAEPYMRFRKAVRCLTPGTPTYMEAELSYHLEQEVVDAHEAFDRECAEIYNDPAPEPRPRTVEAWRAYRLAHGCQVD